MLTLCVQRFMKDERRLQISSSEVVIVMKRWNQKLTINNIKFTVKKPFQPKVTTTGSTRSELHHYTNKRVKNILLMDTQQEPKNNKE